MANGTVGRPKGKARKVSDTQRIRDVLEQFGVTQSAEEVRKRLCRKGGSLAARFRNDKALAVKVAQVKRKLIGEKTGVVRATKGRMTKTERELVSAKLQIQALEAQLASLAAPAVEPAPAVEAAVEAPAAVVAEAAPAVEAAPAPAAEAPVAEAAANPFEAAVPEAA